MKILLLFISVLLFCEVIRSQETTLHDSITIPQLDLKEKELYYTELFNFSENSLYGGLTGFDLPCFNQMFPAKSNWKIDFSEIKNPFFNSTSVMPVTTVGFSPFYSSMNVLNQAHYQLNDKFTIGGSSYAASSIFSPPSLGAPFNNTNMRGVSLFMQYKISKKIKIETRFNISNEGHDL